jgi:hypothetical protein
MILFVLTDSVGPMVPGPRSEGRIGQTDRLRGSHGFDGWIGRINIVLAWIVDRPRFVWELYTYLHNCNRLAISPDRYLPDRIHMSGAWHDLADPVPGTTWHDLADPVPGTIRSGTWHDQIIT